MHASCTAPRGPTARAPFGRPPRAGGAHRAPRSAPPTGVGALHQEPGSARRRASTRHLHRFPHGRATRAPWCCKSGQQHARHHFTAVPGRSGTRRFNPARAYVPETGRAGAGGRRCSAHRALARAGGAIDRHGDQLSKVPDWQTPKMAGPRSSAEGGWQRFRGIFEICSPNRHVPVLQIRSDPKIFRQSQSGTARAHRPESGHEAI